MRALIAAGAVTAALLMSSPSRADPCEGALPSSPGERFDGVVRYVGDGDSLCVGRSTDPAQWIEVRLADFDAPELQQPGGQDGKRILQMIALDQAVTCRAVRGRSGRVIVFDRVIALCHLRGSSIGDILRHRGALTGGR